MRILLNTLIIVVLHLITSTLYSQTCSYSIELTDGYGDGWTGGNRVKIQESSSGSGGWTNIIGWQTLSSGAGPVSYNFTVTNGMYYRVVYQAPGPNYVEETYEIFDENGISIFSNTPWDSNIDALGQLSCSGGGPSGPVNNDCSGAVNLTVESSCTTTNWSIDTDATNSGVALSPSCLSSGSVVQDVWYSFTATETSTNIEVSNNNRKMAFAVYDGSCASLNQIECKDDDDAQSLESATIATTAGQTYYVRVIRNNGSLSNSMTGDICIHSTSGGGGGSSGSPSCSGGTTNMNNGVIYFYPESNSTSGDLYSYDAGWNGSNPGVNSGCVCVTYGISINNGSFNGNFNSNNSPGWTNKGQSLSHYLGMDLNNVSGYMEYNMNFSTPISPSFSIYDITSSVCNAAQGEYLDQVQITGFDAGGNPVYPVIATTCADIIVSGTNNNIVSGATYCGGDQFAAANISFPSDIVSFTIIYSNKIGNPADLSCSPNMIQNGDTDLGPQYIVLSPIQTNYDCSTTVINCSANAGTWNP